MIVVYGKTEAEARRHYAPKEGEVVAYRVYGDNEKKAKKEIYVDESKRGGKSE